MAGGRVGGEIGEWVAGAVWDQECAVSDLVTGMRNGGAEVWDRDVLAIGRALEEVDGGNGGDGGAVFCGGEGID
jgi:hypothetical protein